MYICPGCQHELDTTHTCTMVQHQGGIVMLHTECAPTFKRRQRLERDHQEHHYLPIADCPLCQTVLNEMQSTTI